MRLIFKDTFQKWSETVDINCYTKMINYKGNIFCQLFWLVILLLSTVATFGLIASNVINFLKFEVVSQTSIFNEYPTKFPTITFCDNNPLTTKFAEKLIESLNKTSSSLNKATILSKITASDPSYGDENRKNPGFNYSQIGWTSFNNQAFKNSLRWYWSFDYGNCFQYNSGFNYTNQVIDLINVTRYGVDYGSTVSIFPLSYENKYKVTFSTGMIVFIHNNSFKPSNEVYLEPGKMTFISGKMKIVQQWSSVALSKV